jgi:predicted alpha/beta superfamily hydrolase
LPEPSTTLHSTPPEPSAGFAPLPPDPAAPSNLDANPRFLRLPNFTSRFFPESRDIVVYLPQAYLDSPSTRRFPVFYLNDGQNLFDDRTSFLPRHTWRADTTTDRLNAAGEIEPLILVGVANTGLRRMAEYTPTRDTFRGGGEGPLYGRLLVEELKPLIDRTFRTLPGPANTALGGSSLGGLISLALGLGHPDIFGKIAALSPSVWWDQRNILNVVSNARPRPSLRIWLDMGTAEGLRHLRDADLLHRRLLQRGWQDQGPSPDLHYLRVTGAVHDEDAWADRFDQVLRFLFPLAEGVAETTNSHP